MSYNSSASAGGPEPIAYSVADAMRVSSLGKTKLYALLKDGRLESRPLMDAR
jgi:hypothetical protein